jgi:hypothetical protein
MTSSAIGTFEIEMEPQAPYDSSEGIALSRITIQKRFQGDLDATSTVEMLSAMTGVKGSAGYVAIERVHGSLQGRSGSFVLQHSGTMTRGEPQLSVSVVPDSGTAELKGLSGSMTIEVVSGQHSYRFEYRLEP